MPIYNAPLTTIDKEEARRYAGLRDSSPFPAEMVEHACNEALTLVKPQGCWKVYPYDANSATIIGQALFQLSGNNIAAHLASSVEVAVLAATIGKDLEEAVSALFARGQYSAGLLLDAAGTAAVEAVTDKINQLIAVEASRRGLLPLSRFSPGYGDWDITDQSGIFALSDGQTIHIEVTTSHMLLPRKSVTAIVGLQPAECSQQNEGGTLRGCRVCPRKNCLARKDAEK